MLDALFDFFSVLFYGNENYLYGGYMAEAEIFSWCGLNIDIATYLTLICTWVSFIFILVLCCLFVYKLIKLVGNLIK